MANNHFNQNVVQSIDIYENLEEERGFMKAVTQGLIEVKAGKELDLKDAKRKLGIQL